MTRFHKVCLAAAAMQFLIATPLSAQKSLDEQRCTGQQSTNPAVQISACTALIDSRRYAKPNLSILYSNRGIAYGKAGDIDRAIADFDTAIRITPTHLRAYLNRASAYLAKREFDRAIADLTQALRLDPRSTAVLMSRAGAFEA